MAPESFDGTKLPNCNQVLPLEGGKLLKPVASNEVLIVVSAPLDEEERVDWVEKVDMLLQHGVHVYVNQTSVDPDALDFSNYEVTRTLGAQDSDSLKAFLLENSIEPLDGTSR